MQRISKKWQKHLILARFGTFLKGPLREIDENVLKCAVLHARSPRAIGSHAAFMQDLDRKNTRSAPVTAVVIFKLTWKSND